MPGHTTPDRAREIWLLWDRYARSGSSIEGLLALYAPDAIFESPLVPVLMKRDSGVCRGHDEMRAFFVEGYRRRPNAFVRWYRTDKFFFDGTTLIWEYPGHAPESEQLDLVEVMELRDGLIAHHKVYWGFRGVNELLSSQLERSASDMSVHRRRCAVRVPAPPVEMWRTLR
jgi:hypothetical protein